MSEEVIKKAIVPSADLPLVRFTTVFNETTSQDEINDLYYDFRYRVVSEDKNRNSAWSPIERIVMPDVTTPFPYTTTNRITISKAGNPEVVTAIWTKPSELDNPSEYEKIFNKINFYDVYIRWSTENNATEESTSWTPWGYASTVSSNTFSIIKPDPSYKTVEIAIQVPTENKLRDYNSNKLTLFKQFGQI